MEWAYGITTVPSRIENGLLARTTESLHRAGFDRPWLFIDGCAKLPDSVFRASGITCHETPLRVFGNWVCAAWELYIRNPLAERFAIFQDDFVTYPNLREYLEYCDYPAKGYWNLYTYPSNEKPVEGWYLSNQLGLGALGLVFSNDALRKLLATQYMVDRPLHPERGWKKVDGGIAMAFKTIGYKEYVHKPSLVQHLGDYSTIGNHHQPHAKTFLGEDFDARRLIPETRPRPKTDRLRIGLVGYNCNTGLGELNRQIAKYCEIDTWLLKPHDKVPTNPLAETCDTIVCKTGDKKKIEQFVRQVDCIVFCETPYYTELVTYAQKHSKRLVCVPMLEWMPAGGRGWPKLVDLFLCPTKQCYDAFSKTVPCKYFPWPVDTAHFPYSQRSVCNKFLFIAGHGGWEGRKGIAVIQAARKIWPEMPLAVRSQVAADWHGCQLLPSPASNSGLYSVGDVLVSPHSVDGLGLEPIEALASGMPVISTDGEPWNEFPSIGKIQAGIEKRTIRRPIDWYLPDPASLVEICRGLLAEDISEQSKAGREWAEARDWAKLADSFMELVRHG